MSKYNPTKTERNRLLRQVLWEVQGCRCKICGEPFKSYEEGITEHADRNANNYDRQNIGWVCFSCNQRKRPDYASVIKPEEMAAAAAPPIQEQTRDESASVAAFKAMRDASEEIHRSEINEPKFRRYLWENVGREGELTAEDAIAEGAEVCECSTAAIERNYLKKATSKFAPFYITKGDTPLIKLREHWKPLDTERGRVDAALYLERKKREQEALEQRIQERQDAIMSAEASNRLAEAHKRDAHALYQILKAKGMSDAAINEAMKQAQNAQAVEDKLKENLR